MVTLAEASAAYDESFEATKRLGDDRNCGPASVAISTGTKYDTVYELFKARGRKHAEGTCDHDILAVVNDVGFCSEELPDYAERFNRNSVRDIIDDLPKKGAYLVFSMYHVCALVDGKLFDRDENLDQKFYWLYEITRKED